MSHYLYLVRHGEQIDAEHGILDSSLSERGVTQAHHIGRRLANVPLSRSFTSPLDRAAETAGIIDQYTQGDPVEESTLLFDCVPSGPEDDVPERYNRYFDAFPPAVTEAGRAQMSDAFDAFLTKSREDTHTLLVTHNFVIASFVREALNAPNWRWLGLNSYHASLTVIRVRTTKPVEVLLYNDVSHVPSELRTGVNYRLAL